VFFGGSDIIERHCGAAMDGFEYDYCEDCVYRLPPGNRYLAGKVYTYKHADIRYAHTKQIRHVCSDLAYMRVVHTQIPLHAEMHKHSDYTAWIRE